MIKLCFFFEKLDVTLFLKLTYRFMCHHKYINFSLYREQRIAIIGCTIMNLDREATIKT